MLAKDTEEYKLKRSKEIDDLEKQIENLPLGVEFPLNNLEILNDFKIHGPRGKVERIKFSELY